MDIEVRVDEGKVTITPDVARVELGETVRWVCTGMTAKMQRWIFFFADKSPFKASNTFAVTSPRRDRRGIGSVSNSRLRYEVVVVAGAAEAPGDYKYDVNLTEGGKPIFDVDPWIVVR